MRNVSLQDLTPSIEIDAGIIEGEIDERIYGHFVENMARSLYGGILENEKPGRINGPWKLREDLVLAAKKMKPTVVRWPGGLYADGYNWRDGIGPMDSRPLRINRYWSRYGPFTRVLDPHHFGSHEYMEFVDKLGTCPYINVNFGTGTASEASCWVEYMNGSKDTIEGARRAEYGREEPWNVPIWGIGNEMYGFWSLGNLKAREYADKYSEFACEMMQKDENLEFVAVGSDHYFNKTWNKDVLLHAKEKIDLLSIHIYLPGSERAPEVIASRLIRGSAGIYKAIVAAPLEIERRLKECVEDIGSVFGEEGPAIALDEWNLWWLPQQLLAPRWSLRDALFVCGVFHALHRLSKRVKMANIAQMVNVLGVMVAAGGRFYRTSIYYPFVMYANLTEKKRVRVDVRCGSFSSPRLGGVPPMKIVPYLDCSATLSEDGGSLSLFVINRNAEEDIETEVGIKGFEPRGDVGIHCLDAPDVDSVNYFGRDELVSIKSFNLDAGEVLPKYRFPAHSATAIVFQK
ncbi:MAG: alpha-L-arabinofuranosidase C-terminal domain-containing protein [Actinomycetota bacterium]|nr:alpha-L-arabinofuranosidase C-terminal domain-containing protein [Actinomycetota bacterium]